MTRTHSRTNSTVPCLSWHTWTISFLSQPLHQSDQTYGPLKVYQSLTDRLSPLEDYQVPSLLPVRSNQFWLLHTNCIHSRPSPITPDRTGLKVSPTTPNNQDILQHRQHCSKQTKNFPGHFVLIPTHSKPSTPSPITQDPSWTIQIRPGLCWSIKPTTKQPTLFQVHSNLFWIFFCLPQLLQTIASITITPELCWTSESLPDHSWWPRLTPRSTSLMIVPGPPQHLLATSFSSQQLRTIIVIIQTNHWPLKSSQSLPDRLALLQDYQLCSRYTQTNPDYTRCLSQPLQTINTVTRHSRTTLDQSKPPRPLQKTRTYSWTTSTVPTNHDLSWSLHTYPNQSRSPTPSAVILYPPWATQSSTKPSWSTKSYMTIISLPGPLRPILANPCLSQSNQTIPSITHHSKTTLDQSNPTRSLQKIRTYSMITSTVPNQPHAFLAGPNLSQPLQTIITIAHHLELYQGVFQAHTDLS